MLIDKATNLLILLLKAPFILINFIIFNLTSIIKKTFIHLLNLVKNILLLISNFKDAFFGIIFGFLSGSIGAVVILSYLDINTNPTNTLDNADIVEISKKITALESKNIGLELELKKTRLIESKLSSIDEVVADLLEINNKNSESASKNYQEIEKLINMSNLNTKQINNVKKEIQDTSELMLSASKSDLSNRLYLAQSLIGRLESGVPYAPQLVALGKLGLHPALLRFAKGGAPTNMDLTARLSARAGELRDSYKTKADLTWKDNLKNEISKYVKVKPANSQNIKGMNGVLLRAEEAISKGNLKSAISEINSLDPAARGMLNAWLNEAIAKEKAIMAAENLLAKTTAALKKSN